MAIICLVHVGPSARIRESIAPIRAALLAAGHELIERESGCVGGGQVARFEARVAAAEVTLLVDPQRWYRSSLPWVAALRRRIEHASPALLERTLVLELGGGSPRSDGSPLARLQCFRLVAREWEVLLARVSELAGAQLERELAPDSPRLPTPESPPRQPTQLTQLTGAVAAAQRARGGLVWVRGSMGMGKSQLLANWVAQAREAGVEVAVHRALAGLEWTCTVGALHQRLALALAVRGESVRATEVTHALTARAAVLASRVGAVEPNEPNDPLVMVVDGHGHLCLADPRCRALVELAKPGSGLLLVVASRGLAPNAWPAELPHLDLDLAVDVADGPSVGDVFTEVADASVRAKLEAIAGGNPFIAGALHAALRTLEKTKESAGGSTAEGAVDHAVEQLLDCAGLVGPVAHELERSWSRMLARAGARQRALIGALDLLCSVDAAFPAALWSELATPAQDEALRALASEWLFEGVAGLRLVHPCVRRFLATELEREDPGPSQRVLDQLRQLRRRGLLAQNEQLAAFAAAHEAGLRRVTHELGGGLAWLLELELLAELAQRGALEERLSAALPNLEGEGEGEGQRLVSTILGGVRRWGAVDSRDHFASLLWTEFVSRGWSPTTLQQQFPGLRPSIALINAFERVDRSERVLHGFAGEPRSCAVDGAGQRVIATGNDRHLWSWSLTSGALEQRLELEGWAEACALSLDGSLAVVSHAKGVACWDLERGECVARHEEHHASVTALAMSSDGLSVLSGDADGRLVLWRRGWERTYRLEGHGARVTSCAISADGRRGISSDGEGEISVWDLESAAILHSLSGHSYRAGAVAIDAEGALAASVCVGEAFSWALAEGELIAKHDELGMLCAECHIVSEGREVLGAENNERVLRWDLRTGELRARHLAHGADITTLAVYDDGRGYVTAGQDRKLRVWRADALEGEAFVSFIMGVNALCPSSTAEGVWVSQGGESTRVLGLDGRELGTSLAGASGQRGIAIHGARVVSVSMQHEVHVHAADTGESLASWEAGDEWLRCVAVAPDGQRLAYAGDAKQVFVSDWAGAGLRSFEGHEHWIYALAWASDGRIFSSGGHGQVCGWDPDTGRRVFEYESQVKGTIGALVVLEGGAKLACGGRQLELLDTRGGGRLMGFEGHSREITGLALARDETLLVSAALDASVRVWSVASGEQLARVDLSYGLTCVSVVGGRIIAGDSVGNLAVFEVDWAALELAAGG